MLKDFIKNFNTRKSDDDYMDFNLRGELDIKGYRGGELVYHDGGDNTITLWAKHSVIHALTGDVLTTFGTVGTNIPVDDSANHSSSNFINADGLTISQQQYWWDGAGGANPGYSGLSPLWSQPNSTDPAEANMKYSIYPTKILFGTGRESPSWSSLSNLEQTTLSSIWTTPSSFNTNITNVDNVYSATTNNGGTYQYNGSYPLIQTRTFNDPLSAKIAGSPDPSEYGVQGAVKDGLPGTGNASPTISAANQGIGNPSFIYFQKNFAERWTQSSSEIFLSLNTGDSYEHKVTYTITMPDQTGTYAGWYYPYNGYTLKVVGLYGDSRLCLANTVPTVTSSPDYYNYNDMPFGILFAKRYIAPITKTADLQLSIQWSLYL
jgi:hypothetical protein